MEKSFTLSSYLITPSGVATRKEASLSKGWFIGKKGGRGKKILDQKSLRAEGEPV